MRYGLKLILALTLTLAGPALAGVAATLGYLLGGSYTFAGSALLALCCCGAGALWWHHLVADRAETELASYLKMSAPKVPPARPQAVLPGDVDKMQQRLAEMLSEIGCGCADAIELVREIGRGMGSVATFLDGVEAERDRYQAEAEKVREIAAVAARPMRRLPDIGDGHKAVPDAYGRKGGALPEAVAEAMPAFLRAPPRLVDKPTHRVDLDEIERALATSAPAQ